MEIFQDRNENDVEDLEDILSEYFWAGFPRQCLRALTKNKYREDWESYIIHYDQIVNDSLRKSGPMEGKSLLTALSLVEAVKSMPQSRKNITLFRGVANREGYSMDVKIGDVRVDRGFSSKTHSVATAARFTDGNCCFLMLQYPPGHKFVSFHPDAVLDGERKQIAMTEFEIVTYPGEKFKVVDIVRVSFSHSPDDNPDMETRYEDLKMIVMEYAGNIYGGRNLDSDISQKIDNLYDEKFDEAFSRKQSKESWPPTPERRTS